MTDKSKIGLGTVQFGLPYGISNSGGQTSSREVQLILKTAIENQIEVLDCAAAYGNAEKVLGNFDLGFFKVVSKFMPPAPGRSIRSQMENTLKDLNLPSLYSYLAHRPQEINDSPEQWEEFEELKKLGKVEKIGFSLNEPEELETLLNNGFIPDLIQVPYSYFDRRFQDLIQNLWSKGCEIHTRSTFLQGLFFVEPETLHRYFSDVIPILRELKKNSDNLAGDLLKFVVDQPFIDKVIIGVETQNQLLQNLKELKLAAAPLPKLDYKISDNILIPSRWPKN